MKQQLSQYTLEDHEVWKILFERQIKNLQTKSCYEYLDCLEKIKGELNGNAIPDLEKLSNLLFQNSGWQIEIVPGLIPVDDFFELLAQKKFCSSTWLRKKTQLDYLEEPDMFHDIFGHIPILVNTEFSNFANQLGELGVKHKLNSQIIVELQRLYWFTIEFGLIKQNKETKIYGAGIISSFQETNEIYNQKTTVLAFDLQEIIASDFNNMAIQTKYYELKSFTELFESLSKYRDSLEILKPLPELHKEMKSHTPIIEEDSRNEKLM